MFSWLIIGESSTPFLNVRWFLIRQGLGHTAYMTFVSLAFAVTFFLTRFCIYGTGLVHALFNFRAFPPDYPHWGALSVMAFVVLGFFLNLIWLSKIMRLVFAASKGSLFNSSAEKSEIVAKDVDYGSAKLS